MEAAEKGGVRSLSQQKGKIYEQRKCDTCAPPLRKALVESSAKIAAGTGGQVNGQQHKNTGGGGNVLKPTLTDMRKTIRQ